ncbi:MAG: hypothetical protein K2N51_19870 [Lachnospiraceae bacterium]|nr:hypothetical protein [Lachnospiraceae bacterium]
MQIEVKDFQRKKEEILKRVRDTSLWKFHHTDGREVWGISPMCSDIGSACYGCFVTTKDVADIILILSN